MALFRPDEERLLGEIARVRRVFRQAEGKAEQRRVVRVHQLREDLAGHVARGRFLTSRLFPVFWPFQPSSIFTRRCFCGNWSVTTVPTPSLLSMPTWPPWSRRMRWTIIRPSP